MSNKDKVKKETIKPVNKGNHPPKEALTTEQLSAIIKHETKLGIYDGRYDN